MQNLTLKKIIVTGFIVILGITLIFTGYIYSNANDRTVATKVKNGPSANKQLAILNDKKIQSSEKRILYFLK